MSAEIGGARAVRVQGLDVVARVRQSVSLPVIGLLKRKWKDQILITPSLDDALKVAAAGAEIVATEATNRPRRDRLTVAETVRRFKEESDAMIMADCACLEDALRAEDSGADIIATTLSGYTGPRPPTKGPDFVLLRQIAATCQIPVVLEGRVETPEQAAHGFDSGAHAVCVGSAITHPGRITARFAQHVAEHTSAFDVTDAP
jgi:N-acylglucosamine-6-phosphate 2-epimerase